MHSKKPLNKKRWSNKKSTTSKQPSLRIKDKIKNQLLNFLNFETQTDIKEYYNDKFIIIQNNETQLNLIMNKKIFRQLTIT
jgi:hypothetical protein